MQAPLLSLSFPSLSPCIVHIIPILFDLPCPVHSGESPSCDRLADPCSRRKTDHSLDMGSIVVNHVPSDHIDMLGGAIDSDSVYSFAQPMDTHSTASSTPTSIAPPSVGSARLPVHANDVPAYINSRTPSQASRSSSETPTFTSRPPSMTSHPKIGRVHV